METVYYASTAALWTASSESANHSRWPTHWTPEPFAANWRATEKNPPSLRCASRGSPSRKVCWPTSWTSSTWLWRRKTPGAGRSKTAHAPSCERVTGNQRRGFKSAWRPHLPPGWNLQTLSHCQLWPNVYCELLVAFAMLPQSVQFGQVHFSNSPSQMWRPEGTPPSSLKGFFNSTTCLLVL